MKKVELTDILARRTHRSRAEAADKVDTLIYELLKDLKSRPTQSDAPVAVSETERKDIR